ncbi:MAG TPA: hypothetical protein VM847_19755, partial [Tahibacter sp.]|nr:hypothetical protein [Tahibacter sp.]
MSLTKCLVEKRSDFSPPLEADPGEENPPLQGEGMGGDGLDALASERRDSVPPRDIAEKTTRLTAAQTPRRGDELVE